MRSMDETLPDMEFAPALVITVVIAAALQLSGSWIAMLLAGVLGSLLVRRHRTAFLVGFFGVFLGWLVLYVYLILTAQALVIADFFVSLLGFSGLGGLVIAIGCLIGGLLGGFGALFGRSLVEMFDDLLRNYL